jgi:Peptidase C13 family
MDVEGSTQAAPDGRAWRQWVENLVTGLRLAFFRRPAPFQFHVSANHFIAIAATCLAVNCACSFALAGFGPGGFFNLHALPSTVFWVTLTLFAGYLSGQVMKDDRYALLIPIAVGSIGIPLSIVSSVIWFAADHRWFGSPAASALFWLYQLVFAWWALSTLLAIKRLTVSLSGRTVSPAAIVAMIVLVPVYFLPSEPLWEAAFDPAESAVEPGQRQRAFSERALYAQSELLRAAIQDIKPERAGVEDLYFVGFAPYASQDVFMKETLAIGKLLEERFDVGGRAISLISHPSLVDKFPIATLTSLRQALRAVGERINPDEDVVLLHLTSHGSETHEFSVEFYPLALEAIRPADVRSALDAAGIKWRIVVVSACYSGGFIDALKDAHTMVVTASDAKHTSFGCGDAFDFTYFSKAYFDEALRKTYSFENAFTMARESIRLREQNEGLEHSNPQIFMGEAMQAKLSGLEKRLSARASHAK